MIAYHDSNACLQTRLKESERIVPNIIVNTDAMAKNPNSQDSFSLIMTNINGIGKKKKVKIPKRGI